MPSSRVISASSWVTSSFASSRSFVIITRTFGTATRSPRSAINISVRTLSNASVKFDSVSIVHSNILSSCAESLWESVYSERCMGWLVPSGNVVAPTRVRPRATSSCVTRLRRKFRLLSKSLNRPVAAPASNKNTTSASPEQPGQDMNKDNLINTNP